MTSSPAFPSSAQPEPLNPAELALIERSIEGLNGFDTIVLDVHNYARYAGIALDKPGRSGEMLVKPLRIDRMPPLSSSV